MLKVNKVKPEIPYTFTVEGFSLQDANLILKALTLYAGTWDSLDARALKGRLVEGGFGAAQ